MRCGISGAAVEGVTSILNGCEVVSGAKYVGCEVCGAVVV